LNFQTLQSLGWSETLASALDALADPTLQPARVAIAHRDRYGLYTAAGDCAAVLSGRLRYGAGDRPDLPTVGDWVAIQIHGTDPATIQAVLPRHSVFARKMAGATTEAQTLAANVDTAFLVAGLDQDFNLRRMERYLVLTWDSGAMPVIVLNKVDLCPSVADHVAAVEAIALGVPIIPLSAAAGEGLAALQPYLQPGQTVVLLGSSGVGKSTLTNQLLGAAQQATQATRQQDGKGRHTTTHRELIRLPQGALLIDTPGLREIQLWVSADSLEDTFAEVADLAQQCRFRDCRHQGEPGCAVQAAIAKGTLNPDRVHSYQKMQREVAYLERKQDQRASALEKAKWKSIHKTLRRSPKRH
jgi:ribosome biogenesis GTPase